MTSYYGDSGARKPELAQAQAGSEQLSANPVKRDRTALVYAFTFAASIGRVGLGALSGALAARLLSPSGRGELAVISYFPSLMGSLFTLGTPQALTAMLASSSRDPRAVLAAGAHISAAGSLLACLLFGLLAPRTLPEPSSHLTSSVAIACFAGAFIVVTPHYHAMAFGLRRIIWANSVTLAGSGAYVVCLLGLYASGLISAQAAALAALGCQLLQWLLHLVHLGPRHLLDIADKATYCDCLRLGWRFAVPSLAATILTNADRAILIRTTTVTEIGYFATAFAVTFPITLATEAFTQIGFVEVATVAAGMRPRLLIRRFQMAQIVALIASAGCVLVAAPLIPYAFGESYLPSVRISYALAGCMFLRAIGRTLENNLRALDLIIPGTLAAMLTLAVLIAVSVPTVPRFGAMGFAAAAVVSQVFYVGSLVGFIRQRMAVPLHDFVGLRPSVLSQLLKAAAQLARVPARANR